jgi:hypothetical protein
MTDAEALDRMSAQVDHANEIRERWAAQQQQSTGAAPSAPGMEPAPAVNTSQAVPPAQTTGQPLSGKVSSEAEALARAGLVTKTAHGWETSNPAFQQFADEHNAAEARRQALAMKLLDNPEAFAKEHLNLPDPTLVEGLQKELAEMKQVLADQAATTSDNEVDSWIDTNANQLFVNGDRTGQLTPYGQKYNEFAGHVQRLAADLGQTPDRLTTHRNVVNLMQAAGQSLQEQAPPPAEVPVPQAAPQTQSFIQQAAQTTPRVHHNRLVEHAAQQPNGTPAIPMGKRGMPSLQGIIDQLGSAT